MSTNDAAAALALWWSIDAADRAEFERWHGGEHVAERLALPGFRRGTRWVREASGGGIDNFMLYELDGLEALDSDGYRARLERPTPWSREVMAGFRGMVRSRCRVEAHRGAGVGRLAATWRLQPPPEQAAAVRARLRDEVLPRVAAAPGVCAAWLLQNAPPPATQAVPTAEQRLRGPDATADVVLLLTGWDEAVAAQAEALGSPLRACDPGAELGLYHLQFCASAQDYAASV